MGLRITEDLIKATPAPIDKAQLWIWDHEVKGFGVCISRSKLATFYMVKRVAGKKKYTKIGVRGEARPEDHARWTVLLARKAAAEIGGVVASGAVPVSPSAPQNGDTLRDASAIHIEYMRAKNRSPDSIANVTYYLEKYAKRLLDVPIAAITGEMCAELHAEIKAAITKTASKRTGGRAAANAHKPGAATANKTLLMISGSWSSYNKRHRGKLGSWNPAEATPYDELSKKTEGLVTDTKLPGWYATVQTIANPIRRDLQLFCLFSAMRSESAREIEWKDVDLAQRFLHVPDPKGGPNAKFDLPLGPTLYEILKRRHEDNALVMRAHGGDHGFVFPTITRKAPYRVQPIAEPKEQRVNDQGKKVSILPSPHALRHTYATVASAIKIPDIDQHVLMNHTYGGRNVHEGYIRQSPELLLQRQTEIDAALWQRIKPRKRSGLVLLKSRPEPKPKRKSNRIDPVYVVR